MTREEEREMWLREDLRHRTDEEIYNIFGSRLETIVNQQKERLQLKLKTIWRNRKWYTFRDTGEQIEPDTMLMYFEPKKTNKYSLSKLEEILEIIEHETIYSNPKCK